MKEWIVTDNDKEFYKRNNVPELIRCKDCKYYRKDRFVCDLTKYASDEDDFCSWAERKGKEE